MPARDRGVLGDILGTTARTQLGAIVFGGLGVFLVSPLPRRMLDAVTPARLTDNPYAGMMGNAYVSTGYYFLPWAQLFGFVLICIAVYTMFTKGRNPAYRRRIRSRAANNGLAIGFLVVMLAAGFSNPPHLMPNRHEIAGAEAKLHSGQAAEVKQVAIGNIFPASGTIQWGAEEPIGGNLEDLEIWDVTGSQEDKIVEIRSGFVMQMPGVRTPPYATVYVRAGQHVSLRLPVSRPYTVMAMAGPRWLGPDQLFGSAATTVDFGQVLLMAGQPKVVAMGAPDQTANVVPNDRF